VVRRGALLVRVVVFGRLVEQSGEFRSIVVEMERS